MNELAPIVIAFRLAVGGAPAPVPAPAPREIAPVEARAAAPPDRPDNWFAEDKLRHFMMSVAITQLTFGAARAADLDRDASLAAAAGVSLGAGVWKEFRDRRLGLRFSGKDLVVDALGTGAGVAVASRIR